MDTATLREALDAHEPQNEGGCEYCSCGKWSDLSSDYRTWADHREAAVRAALSKPEEEHDGQ